MTVGSIPTFSTMKIKKLEHGVEFEAENDYERECLKHIAGKQLTSKYENAWDRTGSVVVEFKPHPWDVKR